MNERTPQKDNKEHLSAINHKFDELEMLIYEYLQHSKNQGGTLGFCIGGSLQKIKDTRIAINSMCGKLPPYIHEKNFDFT